MAVTIVTAEFQSACTMVAYRTKVKATFGALNDALVVNHAVDPGNVRQVTLLSAGSPMKMIRIPSADWTIEYTSNSTITVTNLVDAEVANITIVVTAAP